MTLDGTSIAGLVTATVGGAAIGLERQWSGHASGPHARVGGIRTFTMLGGLAGVAGSFALGGFLPIAAVLLAAAAALVVTAYAVAARVDVDGTSEVAALVVLAAGTLAGAGHLATASAVIAATVLLLVEKTRLHAMVRRIDDASLRASARFAAMACIILPLLPAGPYGPLDAIRPRELWALVLFFSGLSFLGWVARRAVGPTRGVVITGLLGGIISSTTVTLQFSRESREKGAPRLALAAGAIGACTIMLLRVTLACAVLNPPLALAVLPYAAAGLLIGVLGLGVVWRTESAGAPRSLSGSPLEIRTALQMTALFQLVLFLVIGVRTYLGPQALIATSVFVGLTDLDALTLSLARAVAPEYGGTSVVTALVAGIVANTVLKGAVALVVGRGAFRAATVTTLAAMALVLVVMIMRT
jgi:uncharacterized membrane protein (DUF4010 family)